jgi:signal transduction histidine kinase
MGDVSARDRVRVGEIDRYDVLDHPPRGELVAIVELAAKVCGTPMATINLISDVQQHQVATYGFEASVCSREDSMCAHVLDEDTPIVVADASLDPRFMDNPFVTGVIGNVRFYASHKLVTLSGVTIGTLCVFDEEPRDLDASQVDALATLADRIVDVLELSWRSRALAVSNERLSTFAGRVSHDLKTPLATLSMSLGLLREQLAEGIGVEDAARLLERAINGSHRMAAMIDDVLSYASLGGGLTVTTVALDDVLDDVLEELAAPLADASVTRGPLPTVRGDRTQLRSLLQNLLDNAAKYRSPERALTVDVSAVQHEGRWCLSIADNGRGVPEAERDRVFQPRVRLDDDDRGSGIGLDTCVRVVQAHGGTIRLEATPGGGATVVVELPA